ncbi:NAD(P)-dependent oxidoreductase [Tengunoibacter tsumagoiensis]|uniref:Dehydrogenase n=1 Tax=Tengunoibacter tsumagoiensis TaxID=2014871 RepID=A0A402A660_9CHLR|nr:NAD(P)-dependent oxidoreductase [Tengunoibacter tsumagoiensis]GCE14618.1 dehydrogenase [Tengunoibacter tsumagoiensis]
MSQERVGFVGLGNMGQAMASNLVQSGYQVTVYNRDAKKAEALVHAGATRADQPGEVARGGKIVLSMVANDEALEAVTLGENGLLESLEPGGIHLSMSTISPALAQKLTKLHAQHQSTYLASPVFGRPEAAAARQLWLAVAGEKAAKERVHAILNTLGQGIFDFGEEPYKANIVKISGNFLIASAMESLGEVFALVEKNDISRRAVIDMFSQTLFASPIYKNYGTKIAERDFNEIGFLLKLGLKDVDLVLDQAKQSQVPMPFASQLHNRFVGEIANGNGERDWMEMTRGIDRDAGLTK